MATAPLDEATAKEVLRQVEFYFSDSNLPRDNFMRKTISESEDGLVDLALICSFKKMKGYLKLEGDVKVADIPDDTLQAVADTLRKSSSLKISDDGKKVGRIAALLEADEAIEQLDMRTIAASPIEYNAKMEDVKSFFEQYSKVSSVRMPRHVADKRVFCGSALIEFTSEEDAAKVLKQSLVLAGLQLELKPKKEFDAERAKQEEEFKSSRPSSGFNAEADYPKGLIVGFKLKGVSSGNGAEEPVSDVASEAEGEPKSSENASQENEPKLSENASANKEDNEMNVEEGKEEKVDEENATENKEKEIEEGKSSEETSEKEDKKQDHVKAAAYKNDKNIVMREDLKAVFQKFGTVKFIDFKIGEESGYIRFEEPEAAQKARAAAVLAEDGGLCVKNFIAILEPVTGEAEKEYWNLLRGNQEKVRGNTSNRGRGGKNFRGGKHPRSRDYNYGGRPNKAQKV